MALRIKLSDTGSPAEQIADQLRGIIMAGHLAGGERLPSVRQLAGDLGIAPGTVARVYKSLESEGLITTRIGSGARVREGVTTTPRIVIASVREMVSVSHREGVSIDEILRVVRALWGREDPTD